MNYLVEGIAVGLLAIPLLRLTWVGYDRFWWQRSEMDLLPFPSRWTVRSYLWVWYLLFWALSLGALVMAATRGRAAILAIAVAGIEGGYALMNRGRKAVALDPSFPESILAYGLWHNALMEELIFRGLPLLAGVATGLSTRAFWPYLYVSATALAFGLYHLKQNRPVRFFDTTAFGAVLGVIVMTHGLLGAILVHSIHNALSIPLGHTALTVRTWRRNRWLYVAGLSLVALLRLSVSGSYSLVSSGIADNDLARPDPTTAAFQKLSSRSRSTAISG